MKRLQQAMSKFKNYCREDSFSLTGSELPTPTIRLTVISNDHYVHVQHRSGGLVQEQTKPLYITCNTYEFSEMLFSGGEEYDS